MNYILVVQIPTEMGVDLDDLINIEDQLGETFGPEHVVDGHDAGTTEMNIFIHTDSPDRAFAASKPILLVRGIMPLAKVAARRVGEEEYSVIWPPGETSFKIM